MPRRSSYTTTLKVRVIEFVDTNGNHVAIRHFGIDESNDLSNNLIKCPNQSELIEVVL